MRALCWNGVNDLRVETVPDPAIVNPHDAILRVTMSTTCGSDLHFIDGYIPTMRPGDVIGHEFMGEVVDVGPAVKKVKKGERVVVPSFICCGECFHCRHDLWSLCDNTNPNAEKKDAGTFIRLFNSRHLRLYTRFWRVCRFACPIYSRAARG